MRESMFPNPMACRNTEIEPALRRRSVGRGRGGGERAPSPPFAVAHRRVRRAPRRARTRGRRRRTPRGFPPPTRWAGDGGGFRIRLRARPATNPNAPNDVSRRPNERAIRDFRARRPETAPGARESQPFSPGGRGRRPRHIQRSRCVTSTARRTPKAPRSLGRLLRGELADEAHAARVLADAALHLLGPRLEHHRVARGVGRAAASACRVHGGGRDVDALAGRASGGAAALERAFGDGEGGGRGYGSGGVQRRGASARGVRGTGLDHEGFMLARFPFRAMAHARDPKDYRARARGEP